MKSILTNDREILEALRAGKEIFIAFYEAAQKDPRAVFSLKEKYETSYDNTIKNIKLTVADNFVCFLENADHIEWFSEEDFLNKKRLKKLFPDSVDIDHLIDQIRYEIQIEKLQNPQKSCFSVPGYWDVKEQRLILSKCAIEQGIFDFDFEGIFAYLIA